MTVFLRRLFLRSIAWQLCLGLVLCTATPSLRAGSSLAALDAFHVGRYHLANGNREQALEAFNDAVRMNPQMVPAYIARGKLLAEMGRHESALADLNFALRLQPTHAEGFAYRGYALLSMGKTQEAMPEFDMAIRLDPSYARVHYLRGQSLKQMGNDLAADAALETARRLDPSIEATQVIAAVDNGIDSTGAVRLAGPTALERSSIIADTAVPPAPKLSSADQGRVLLHERHPLLSKLQSPSEMHGIVSPPGPYRQTLADPNNPVSIASRFNKRPMNAGGQTPSATAERPMPGTKLSTKIPLAPPSDFANGQSSLKSVAPLPQDLDPTAKGATLSPDGLPLAEGETIVGGISVVDAAPAARAIFDGSASPHLPPKPSTEESNRRLSAAIESAKQAVAGNAEAPKSVEMPGDAAIVSDMPEPIAPPALASDAPTTAGTSASTTAALATAPEPQEIPIGGLPSTAEACRSRGLASEELGNFSEALTAYDEAVRLDPNDPQNFCLRGHLNRKEGRADEATEDFENAIRLAPGLAIGYFGRGLLLCENERYADAADDFSVAVRLDDAYAEALFERGLCYSKLGRKDEAEADRRAALALDPSLAKTGPKYGAAFEQITRAESSVLKFEEGVTIVSDAPTTNDVVTVGDAPAVLPTTTETAPAKALNAKPDAMSAELRRLNEQIAQTPGEGKLYVRRAELLLKTANAEEALDDLHAALRILPDDVDALRLRAEAHLALSRFPAAQEDLNDLLRLEPNDASLYAERGSVRLALGMTDEAKQDLTQAIALDDGCASAYCRRGLALALDGETERAMADFASAIERDPTAAEAHLCRAKAYIEINRTAEAMADLNRAIELDPNCAEAYFERSRLYAQRRAFEKSQSDRRRALELDPTLR